MRDNESPKKQQQIEDPDSVPEFDSLKADEEKVGEIKKVDIDKTAAFDSLQAKIAESQESTRGKLAVTIMSIYGATILFCFVVIGFGIAEGERKEVLTLIITSQATLIGSAIGFYFGKNQ